MVSHYTLIRQWFMTCLASQLRQVHHAVILCCLALWWWISCWHGYSRGIKKKLTAIIADEQVVQKQASSTTFVKGCWCLVEQWINLTTLTDKISMSSVVASPLYFLSYIPHRLPSVYQTKHGFIDTAFIWLFQYIWGWDLGGFLHNIF